MAADLQQAEEERGAWRDTAAQCDRNSNYYQAKSLGLQQAIRRALNELGVPTLEYPAPVANAVALLEVALNNHGIVDGFAVHADDCSGHPCTCTDPTEKVEDNG